MRNVIFAINVTIDGCCDHTKGIADEELLDYYIVAIGGGLLLVSQMF